MHGKGVLPEVAELEGAKLSAPLRVQVYRLAYEDAESPKAQHSPSHRFIYSWMGRRVESEWVNLWPLIVWQMTQGEGKQVTG